MFQDEARFGRMNVPMKCWCPMGYRPRVLCQQVREFTYVYACVDPFDGTLDSLILPETNTTVMNIFLNEVSERHNDEFIIMVVDGAMWHVAEDIAIPTNIKLLYLPPYSPELNPTEHIWDEIREKWFGNTTFKTLAAVEDRLIEALSELENDKERVSSLVGFNWIISNPLIAT